MNADRRIEAARRQTLQRVKDAIAERIRRVCTHLDPEDFDELTTRMAHIEIKYSLRNHAPFAGARRGEWT